MARPAKSFESVLMRACVTRPSPNTTAATRIENRVRTMAISGRLKPPSRLRPTSLTCWPPPLRSRIVLGTAAENPEETQPRREQLSGQIAARVNNVTPGGGDAGIIGGG